MKRLVFLGTLVALTGGACAAPTGVLSETSGAGGETGTERGRQRRCGRHGCHRG